VFHSFTQVAPHLRQPAPEAVIVRPPTRKVANSGGGGGGGGGGVLLPHVASKKCSTPTQIALFRNDDDDRRRLRTGGATARPSPTATANEIIISLPPRLAGVMACRRNGRMIKILFLKFGFVFGDNNADRPGRVDGRLSTGQRGHVLPSHRDRSSSLPRAATM